MFDIGFPELLVVTVVMLLVLGPERLPETLRMLGLWLGRLRRSFNAVKSEIEKEVGMDEIKRQLHNEAIMDEMKRLEAQVRTSMQEPAQNAPEPHAPVDEAARPGKLVREAPSRVACKISAKGACRRATAIIAHRLRLSVTLG